MADVYVSHVTFSLTIVYAILYLPASFMEGIDSDDSLDAGICVEMREAELLQMWPGPRMVPVQGNKYRN